MHNTSHLTEHTLHKAYICGCLVDNEFLSKYCFVGLMTIIAINLPPPLTRINMELP